MEKNKNMGILFIVLSAFSFAWMSTFVRLAGDLPSVEKSFFRNLVAVGVAAFTMIRSKEKIVMGKGNLKFLILRALFEQSEFWETFTRSTIWCFQTRIC